MNAMLDTHALVWWVDGSKRLASAQRRATDRAASTGALFLSEISFWRIAMPVDAGKLTFREPLDEWLERAAAAPAV